MSYEHRLSFPDTDFPNLAAKLKPTLTELSHQRGNVPEKLLILLPKHLSPKDKASLASAASFPAPLKAVRELVKSMRNAKFYLCRAESDTTKQIEVVVTWS
jgi:hypothetical protein